jgi:DNA helicase HerA-like ATPase
MKDIIPCKYLAEKMALFEPSEPLDQNVEPEAFYLGKTLKYRAPVFYSPKRLINPHIALIGTTGSGKTNMMLNLIMKFSSNGGKIVIIDWSGEYSTIAQALGMETLAETKLPTGFGGVYIDLSKFNTGQRMRFSASLLNFITTELAKGRMKDTTIFIDEVWHFLDDSKTKNYISIIFREGRKYDVGMVVATQLVGDINNEIIYNSGTLLIFKIYGSENISSLKLSMLLEDKDLEFLPELNQGSCYSIMLDKTGLVKKTVLRRIQKFSINFCTLKCGTMEYKMTKRTIMEIAAPVLGKDIEAKLDFLIESDMKSVDMEKIALLLLKNECSREKIIYFFRKLGVDDFFIADSIGSALSKVRD